MSAGGTASRLPPLPFRLPPADLSVQHSLSLNISFIYHTYLSDSTDPICKNVLQMKIPNRGKTFKALEILLKHFD